jgi:small-conductance mechanosensitive channel
MAVYTSAAAGEASSPRTNSDRHLGSASSASGEPDDDVQRVQTLNGDLVAEASTAASDLDQDISLVSRRRRARAAEEDADESSDKLPTRNQLSVL